MADVGRILLCCPCIHCLISYLLSKTAGTILNPVHKIVDKAKDKVENLNHGVNNIVDETKDKIGNLNPAVNDIVDKAKTKIGNTHLSDVKVPKFFGRGKEAIVGTINEEEELITEEKRDQYSTKLESSASSSGLNVFQRSKAAMKGMVDVIHPKMESRNMNSSTETERSDQNKEEGFWAMVGMWLDKVCRSRSENYGDTNKE